MYTNIVIVGTGKIACSCLDYVVDRTSEENILVYEYCSSSLSILRKKAEQHRVGYAAFEVQSELTGKLLVFVAGEILLLLIIIVHYFLNMRA